MNLIVFSSPKGGVGKTTLAAHVAAELATCRDVLLVTLDAGHDLAFHFHGADADLAGDRFHRIPATAVELWAAAERVAASLRVAALSSPTEDAPSAAEAQTLIEMLGSEGPLVVVDAPMADLARARAMAGETGLLIYVLGADAACLAAVPAAEAPAPVNDGQTAFCLNLIDPRRALCRDVEAMAIQALGERLVARIRFDAHVPEAAAAGRLVREHAPASQASRDLRDFADLLDRLTVSPVDTAELKRA